MSTMRDCNRCHRLTEMERGAKVCNTCRSSKRIRTPKTAHSPVQSPVQQPTKPSAAEPKRSAAYKAMMKDILAIMDEADDTNATRQDFYDALVIGLRPATEPVVAAPPPVEEPKIVIPEHLVQVWEDINSLEGEATLITLGNILNILTNWNDEETTEAELEKDIIETLIPEQYARVWEMLNILQCQDSIVTLEKVITILAGWDGKPVDKLETIIADSLRPRVRPFDKTEEAVRRYMHMLKTMSKNTSIAVSVRQPNSAVVEDVTHHSPMIIDYEATVEDVPIFCPTLPATRSALDCQEDCQEDCQHKTLAEVEDKIAPTEDIDLPLPEPVVQPVVQPVVVQPVVQPEEPKWVIDRENEKYNTWVPRQLGNKTLPIRQILRKANQGDKLKDVGCEWLGDDLHILMHQMERSSSGAKSRSTYGAAMNSLLATLAPKIAQLKKEGWNYDGAPLGI